MAGNSGGPWGGGGGSGGGGNRGNDDDNRGGRRPGEGQQIPEIDEIVRKGQEQLRVLMGGRGGGSGGSGGGEGPQFGRGTVVIGVLAALALWAYASVYTVAPEERSVELFLGERFAVRDPGLNFAPWPLVRAEIVEVTTNRTESIGIARSGGGDTGLMLTTDENIVDIDFEVVWNISNPEDYLFNLAEPEATVRAVSEAAMREIIAASQLAPILNRDRQIIADTVQDLIQQTLNSYESGINVVRLNLDRADPPVEVIDAFRDVQAAEQERDRLERQADAYANQVLAGARGEAAQLLEEAEAYRAQVVNEAQGEASRFSAVLAEYRLAPEVTRQRLYLETMERVLGGMETIILDTDSTGGVVPYLPLNELRNRGN
ncbi:FtsH protease activity modulator HflK [Nioella aestuarii]|uniref:FtsH protease activity modulator HflK n=1 Tax=Nioella aestuarii TaxID=1662864 RepID=UPI003D7FF857